MTLKFEYDPMSLAAQVARARSLLEALPGRQRFGDGEHLQELARIIPAPYDSNRAFRGTIERWRRRLAVSLLGRQQMFNEKLLDHLDTLRADTSFHTPPRSLIFAPYHIRDRRTGGAVRIDAIARALAQRGPVLVVSLEGGPHAQVGIHAWADGVRLVTVPRSKVFKETMDGLKPETGYLAHFMAVARYPESVPELHYILSDAAVTADIMIAVTPYAWPALAPHAEGKRVFYDCHDDQVHFLKHASDVPERDRNVEALAGFESDLCHASHGILVTSDDDGKALAARHGVQSEKMTVLRNGVDLEESLYMAPDRARILREAVGLHKSISIFVGSEHVPNVQAVRWIAEHLAPARPEELFFIVGMPYELWGRSARCRAPTNMVFTGKVRSDVKGALFALSTTALCPLFEGTGSSLKVPEYLARGKITISTPVGLRGFPGLEEFVRVAEAGGFATQMDRVSADLAERGDAVAEQCRRAREFVERHLSWPVVTEPLREALEAPKGEKAANG